MNELIRLLGKKCLDRVYMCVRVCVVCHTQKDGKTLKMKGEKEKEGEKKSCPNLRRASPGCSHRGSYGCSWVSEMMMSDERNAAPNNVTVRAFPNRGTWAYLPKVTKGIG